MQKDRTMTTTYAERLSAGDWTQWAQEPARWLVSTDAQSWFDAVPGEKLRIRVRSADVRGRYTILESVAEPDAGVPLHTHLEDEVFHILEGVLTFEAAGERFEASAGAVVVVPGGVAHAWRNFGDRASRCLTIFTPGGVDELFAALPHIPPGELASVAARYGTVVLGPPIER